MGAADRLEDGFPHGTFEGYKAGCRNGGCPAGAEHGLSCKRAQQLHAGDYRFQRLVRAGKEPWEIALELGLVPETHDAPKTKRKPVVADDEAQDDVEVDEGPVDEPEEEIVVEKVKPTPKDVAPKKAEKVANPKKPEPSPRARKVWQIRQWAKANGIKMADFGRIPRDIEAAYDEAHKAGDTPVWPKWTVDGRPAEEVKAEEAAHTPTADELADLFREVGEAITEAEEVEGAAIQALVSAALTAELERDERLRRAEAALELTLRKWAEEREARARVQGMVFVQARAHSTERDMWRRERDHLQRMLDSAGYRIAELEEQVERAPRPWFRRAS